ncbi:hypothetical protein OF83DRAFT_1088191 [Amylostereum chailletii]|nr:hypothetical protein OF83DRAFT_1088191 [Amylostereum chailletii]
MEVPVLTDLVASSAPPACEEPQIPRSSTSTDLLSTSDNDPNASSPPDAAYVRQVITYERKPAIDLQDSAQQLSRLVAPLRSASPGYLSFAGRHAQTLACYLGRAKVPSLGRSFFRPLAVLPLGGVVVIGCFAVGLGYGGGQTATLPLSDPVFAGQTLWEALQ